jgi:catechol-2,3-dioxygenase
MTADHTLTKSFYFLDPDGNRLEIYSQVMSHPEGKQFLHDTRLGADAMHPLDLEAVTS